MRIATFNLENLDSTPEPERFKQRISILRPQLERLDADVLCLQEVNGQRQSGDKNRNLHALDELLQGTPYARFARVTTTGDDGTIADVHNLVILSRLPIRAHRQVRHHNVPGIQHHYLAVRTEDPSVIRFDRPVLLAEIDAGSGLVLHVCNVHLRAPLASAIPGEKQSASVWSSVGGWAEGYFISELKRCAQALELRLLVEDIFDKDSGAWIAVCGDFNAEDHHAPLAIAIAAEEDTGNGLLAGRSLIAVDRGLPADRRFSVVHHGRPQMFDHILVSRPLWSRFKSIEVHNEALEDGLIVYDKVSHPAGSCHAPLVAEVNLQVRAATATA